MIRDSTRNKFAKTTLICVLFCVLCVAVIDSKPPQTEFHIFVLPLLNFGYKSQEELPIQYYNEIMLHCKK